MLWEREEDTQGGGGEEWVVTDSHLRSSLVGSQVAFAWLNSVPARPRPVEDGGGSSNSNSGKRESWTKIISPENAKTSHLHRMITE